LVKRPIRAFPSSPGAQHSHGRYCIATASAFVLFCIRRLIVALVFFLRDELAFLLPPHRPRARGSLYSSSLSSSPPPFAFRFEAHANASLAMSNRNLVHTLAQLGPHSALATAHGVAPVSVSWSYTTRSFW
tara:strand:+ start:588 stop:980 length:393 start_codon:yes stop_codon:yes gene_type:complete